MQKRNKVLDALREAGIDLNLEVSAPSELSESVLSKIGGGTQYIREHDQFYKVDYDGTGGAFWKSIWRYTPVVELP